MAFEQFCHEQAAWLEDYALFRALKIRYNGVYYSSGHGAGAACSDSFGGCSA